MFASQLLRILQTIPTDVDHETCDFNTDKPKLSMMEDKIGIVCDSNAYGKETDRLSFSASDPLHANGHGGNSNSLVFGIQDEHDFWNSAVFKSSLLDDSTRSNDNEPGGSPVDHLNGFEIDAESFLFDTRDKNGAQITEEAAHSVMDGQTANGIEEESKDSETSTVPHTFESDLKSFTDKNVVECELPDFVVCYKESNTPHVKDICVDEGVHEENKILIESSKDEHAGSVVSQPSDEDRYGGTTNDPDIEFFVPDGFKVSSPEHNRHDTASEFGAEKIDKTETSDDGSEDGSSISSACVSEELILQKALLECSKCDEDKVSPQPDEVPCLESVLESLAVAFTSEQSKTDGPVSNTCYNSKVEGGTITFDFNSSKPNVSNSIDASAELTTGKAPETEDEKPSDRFASSPAQLVNNEGKIKENPSDRKLLRKDASNDEIGNSGNFSVSSYLERGDGESSFSTSGPVSGLITYSGPIAYSGNVSLRSDSSTTSTRSFAFPILQNEWNSSPVRMEKARKHRGWRHGLLCCRF